MHLAVLEGMDKKTGPRYLPRLNILGCFTLVHAFRMFAQGRSWGARALADWKARVRAGWPEVRVDHVESAGVGEVAKVGDVVTVRAYVSLDGLRPEDVEVQVLYGRVSEADVIDAFTPRSLEHVESYEGGRHRLPASRPPERRPNTRPANAAVAPSRRTRSSRGEGLRAAALECAPCRPTPRPRIAPTAPTPRSAGCARSCCTGPVPS